MIECNKPICKSQGCMFPKNCPEDKPSAPVLGSVPAQGSDAAVALGCTCPRLDNAYGKGYMGCAGVFVTREDCPIHGLNT